MKDIIAGFANDNNIIYGICDALPIPPKAGVNFTDAPFVSKDIDARLNPRLFFPEAKSIVVIGLHNSKEPQFAYENRIRGKLSSAVVNVDYHIEIRIILENLAKAIKAKRDFVYKIHIDTGPICEREIALKAGLGSQGKNCSIINEKFGSMFNIGLLITDIELELCKSSRFGKDLCGNCNNCVKACPLGALNEPYHCNYTKCISYLTQKKGVLSRHEMEAIGYNIYGCDICQNACPYNEKVTKRVISRIDGFLPNLEILLSMSKSEFHNAYHNSDFYWRGRTIIFRNAIIALGNSKDIRGKAVISKFLNSESSVLRQTAEIALEILADK